MRELSSDEEDCVDPSSSPRRHSTTSGSVHDGSPWLVTKEFNSYLNSSDEVDENLSLVEWWGVSYLCFTGVFDAD
jgi:hypothetical protein